MTLETALRFMVIGQELLIGVIFLSGRGNRAARVSGALLLAGIAAYLFISSIELQGVAKVAMPILLLFAMIVPPSLWLFARAVFEAPWPRRWVVVVIVLVLGCAWGLFASPSSWPMGWLQAAGIARHITSLVIVAHVIFMAAQGRPDDLVEQRRKFRAYFVAIVAVQVAIVLGIELLLGEAAPPWLATLNVLIIAAMTIGLAIPMLRLSSDFFGEQQHVLSKEELPAARLSPSEQVLGKALATAMTNGAYRRPGLTIRVLADQLGHPEHQLRKLINGYLGYRNFSAYLNSYRVAEAQRCLADPTQVRTPVLTIALDLGYGSLGPFNRAFKTITGSTPTEYRRTAISE